MREIKFRGKPIEDYGDVKWFYGNAVLNYDDKLAYIEADRQGYVPVEWESIGQYTGLKDKNGREIYEGDVVKNHRRYSNELLEVFWQEEVADYSSDGVYWTKEVPGFRFKRINKGMMTVFVANVDLEVIGNIYEDPELQEASHASK
ncbi:YopX family protein [Bacillus atrophaeus]|uniref:YopX family protein n=1 Tax=Bacillus atrophaeus TaxID=1452 RepID=UPI0018F4C450|nr:YopX family protein [Bacillus atrophaeus]MBJ7897223.1 hypothetical protein [Bacillus atrophaeus]